MICLFSLCVRNIYGHSNDSPVCLIVLSVKTVFQNFRFSKTSASSTFFPVKYICFTIVFYCPQIIAAWMFSAHEANIDLGRLPTNGPVEKHRSNADCFLHV